MADFNAMVPAEDAFFPQVGARIFMVPWNRVKCILDKCGGDQGKALFYIEETIRGKNETTARYALESSAQPLGISSYELSALVPEEFKGSLPAIEENPKSSVEEIAALLQTSGRTVYREISEIKKKVSLAFDKKSQSWVIK